MSIFLALSVFLTTSAGVYLLLDRSMFRVILGVGFIGHATNLIVLASGRWRSRSPIVDETLQAAEMADPLPHAFILTAIVISMAVTIYLMALMVMNIRTSGLSSIEPAPETDAGRQRDNIRAELEGRTTSADAEGAAA